MMLHKLLVLLYWIIVWYGLAASEHDERMQAEWVEIANDLTPTECERFIAALHLASFELPEDFLDSPDGQPGVQSSDGCLSRLRAWRRGEEGRRVDWPHIVLRLRQINRPDVADRISDAVAEVRQHDVNSLFLSNPFHDMIKHHRSSFLVEQAGDKTAANGQRGAMSARRKRDLSWRYRSWHIGPHAVKTAPHAKGVKVQRKSGDESAWLVAMVVVPCAVVAMTTVLLGVVWAYMYWKQGKHFRLRWIFNLTRNDMKLYQRESTGRVSEKTSRREPVRMKQDQISESLGLGSWREDQVYPGCVSVQAVSDASADGSVDVGTIRPVAMATNRLPLFGENDLSRPKRKRTKDSVIRDETRPSGRPVIPALHLPTEDDGNESGARTCPIRGSLEDECPICQYLVTSVKVTDSLSSLSPSPSESSLPS